MLPQGGCVPKDDNKQFSSNVQKLEILVQDLFADTSDNCITFIEEKTLRQCDQELCLKSEQLHVGQIFESTGFNSPSSYLAPGLRSAKSKLSLLSLLLLTRRFLTGAAAMRRL